MKKLKIGQKVLVKTRKELEQLSKVRVVKNLIMDDIADNSIVDNMFDFCGKIVTIQSFSNSSRRIKYWIEEDPGYTWDIRWFKELNAVAKVLFD